MKCFIVLLVLVVLTKDISSQNVAINSSGLVADPSSILDLNSTNSGLLIPRIALSSTTIAAPVASPLTSLMVYNIVYCWRCIPGILLLERNGVGETCNLKR